MAGRHVSNLFVDPYSSIHGSITMIFRQYTVVFKSILVSVDSLLAFTLSPNPTVNALKIPSSTSLHAYGDPKIPSTKHKEKISKQPK